MKRLVIPSVCALLLGVGAAFAQIALPMQAVSANRVVIGLEGRDWNDVAFQARSATFDDGDVRIVLNGDAHISINGHQFSADRAVIRTNSITLEGNAVVTPPTGQR